MLEDSVAELPSLWASMNSWFTPTVFFVLLNLMIGTIALTSTLANQTKHHSQTDVSQQHKLNLPTPPSLLQRVRSINFSIYKQQQQKHTNHFVLPAESHSFFNFDNFLNPEILTNPPHYIFDNAHKEIAPQELENQLEYFQQQHQENGKVLNTQYEFEQPKDLSTQNVDDSSFIESGSYHLNQENIEEEEEEHGDEVQSLEEVYSKVIGHHVSRTKSDTSPSAGEIPAKLTRKVKKSAGMKSPFGHFEAEDVVEIRRPATVRERGVAKVEEADEEVDAKADDFINKFKQQLKLQRIDSITRYKEMINRGSAN